MARRRPITSHPAFAPLIALWFAALLGLTIAVLPAAVLEAWLARAGLAGPSPLTPALRVVASALAAALGGLAGYALARRISRSVGDDPRPVYVEAEPEFDEPAGSTPTRRPLHVREELADGFGDESQVMAPAPAEPEPTATGDAGARVAASREEPDSFMILTPQPIHPPRPAPDLEALLDQFDSAFAAFRAGEGGRAPGASERPGADPVQAFVARQTGAPAPSPSPMGGLVPDHQAELRAALDKLARSQRKD